MSSGFYDSIVETLLAPQLIVLKEADNVMFADIDKVVAKDGIFYIMDSFGARTVVSFKNTGEPYVKYGKIGQGPGEYSRPYDIDVDDRYVYILDSSKKKILQFKNDGVFVGERSIPFIATAFKLLDNGNFVFRLLPDGEASPRICVADNKISDVKYYLQSEKGYVGGFWTKGVFRNNSGSAAYYEAPSDTMYNIDADGTLTGGLIFNFGDKKVPKEAQIDFLSARRKGILERTLRLGDNPIKIANGLMAGIVLDDETQYTLLFNPEKNKCGARKYKSTNSVYEILEPCAADDKGNLVCYTSLEEIEDASDFDSLPDSIKSELKNNNRILMLYSFDK